MDNHDTEGALRQRIVELERALEESERHSRKLEEVLDAAPGIMGETEGALGTPEDRTIVLDVTKRRRAQAAHTELLERAQALSTRLDNLITSVPGMVWEAQGGAESALSDMGFVSPFLAVMTGYPPEEAVNNPSFWSKLTHPDDKGRVSREIREVYERGGGVINHRWITKDGRIIWVESHVHVMRDEASLPISAYGVTMDITARKLAEEAEVRLRDEVINAQAATLAELGAPLIPISAEVLVMPLLGAIDAQRASRVIETLLQGITRARARVAILDITGVPSVDAVTADALLRAARSVRLLGAEVVLTGMRPEVAQALVTLGVALQGIVTRGTLESGIAYATRA